MLKKITLITLLVIFSGVLVVGAANRTFTKTEKINESGENIAQDNGESQSQNEHEPLSQENGQGGQGQGAQANDGERQNRNAKEPLGQESSTSAQSNGAQANQDPGQSNRQGGKGQSNSAQEIESRQGNQGQGNRNNSESNAQNQQQENLQNRPAEIHEWQTLTGTVSQAPADGVDMLLQTSAGEVLVGTGPGYLTEQGYIIKIDDELEVTGFFENDEFKVTTITNLEDGSMIALRDELGRPFWSGAARGGGYGKQE